MNLAIFQLGTWEIVAIVAVGLLLFGSRLPSIARSLGKSVTEFKHGVKDIQSEVTHEPEAKKLEQPAEKRELPAAKIATVEPTASSKEASSA